MCWASETAAVLLSSVEATELLASALRKKFWYKRQLGQGGWAKEPSVTELGFAPFCSSQGAIFIRQK